VGVFEALSGFEDPQAALFFLWVYFGVVWVNHFMRTTPLALWRGLVVRFYGLPRKKKKKIPLELKPLH
jgi:hypothetical protein